jgi:D-alanyl-D-alanine carboxypeptidase/D-alanyl-D-alanine-endopeptidase (penicillin-binding protein 4)
MRFRSWATFFAAALLIAALTFAGAQAAGARVNARARHAKGKAAAATTTYDPKAEPAPAVEAPPPSDAPRGPAPEFSAAKLARADKILHDPILQRAKASFVLEHLASGRVMFAHNPDLPCSPASTNKLITGAAAFAILGPGYRFKTRVFADSRPDGHGVVHGNLYLVGGGDPMLTEERAWTLAHELRLLGLRRVTGNLVGDDSFHDAERYYELWGPPDFRAYKAPLGALSVNYNTVNFWVRPGPKAGAPAAVELDP